MQHLTASGSGASPPARRPAFVPGMGHRMATAALRPRPAAARRADATPLPTAADTDSALCPSTRSVSPAHVSEERAALARVCQVAALCAAAASGATLLYWAKSGSAAQNREITHATQATQQARDHTAMLRTEWASLNDPGRLQDLADRTLSLHSIAPAQFVEPAALHAWLQAPVSAPPASADPDPPAVAEAEAPSVADRLTPEPPVAERPAPEKPAARTRLVADLSSLPLPPAPARTHLPRPAPSAVLPPPYPPPEPGLRLAHAAAPARFELPHWLQGRSPPPTVLALSEPPHEPAPPPIPRAVVPRTVVPSAVVLWATPRPAPVPPRSPATIAASSGDVTYDGRAADWYPRAVPVWPYGVPARPPYGWSPPYGQMYLPN